MLGLDGASLAVIEPLARAGRLPTLARWLQQGAASPLGSTVPPMSFPAWTTLSTGLLPGDHGVFDFTQKIAGAYRIRFVNASDRRGETIFARASRAGARVVCLGMPATFPPEPLNGLAVAGFDAPISTGTHASSASDPVRYQAIAERAGDWMQPELDETARDEGFHERAVGVLVRRVERKTEFALETLRQLGMGVSGGHGGPELVSVVFSESDTAQHHYWRDFDPTSPRHDPSASAVRRDAIAAVYEALDTACARIAGAMGDDARVIVVSDHGAGSASDRVVHLGARLAECGLLRRSRKAAGTPVDAIARSGRDLALRLLPPSLAQRVFRRVRGTAARIESLARFGGTDWSHTVAFSEEVNTQPGVWLNVRGREASGVIEPHDVERVRRDVIDALLDWKLPGGGPVVARALPREDVYAGPCRDLAPDVVIELALDRGHGLSLVPTPWRSAAVTSIRQLAADEHAGGRGRGMNGVHRPLGIFLAATRECVAAAGWPSRDGMRSIEAVAPAVMRLLGIAAPIADDTPALPNDSTAALASRPYDASEQALIADRLRALGYLE